MEHLPALQIVVPLVAAPLCVLIRQRKLVLGFGLVVAWSCPVMAASLLLQVLETGTLSYALGGWLELADGEAVLSLSAILDAVPIAGRRDLFNGLQAWLQERLPRTPEFFEKMLRPILKADDAPAFFEQGTRHGREIDLKQYGIFPIVHGVRTLALEVGVSNLNTFRRLEALKSEGIMDGSLADDLSEALLLFNRLRLGRQLQRLEDSDSSLVPSEVASLVHTEQLASGELALLRDAFRKVRELRTLLGERYGLG